MKITGAQMPQQQSISRRQETDSFEKNIRRQIDGMKEQLQKLSENEELDPKAKMKKKEEINRQISELEAQLTEHKAQKKEEEQEQKVQKEQKEQPNRDRFEQSDGSAENMKDVLSADVSLKKASAREGAANSLERISRTLESEIRQDKRRGVSTERKEADLAEIHSRINKVNRQVAEEAGKIGKNSKIAEGVGYLSDLKKKLPGTEFFVGTVSYGQTYGKGSDVNFVVNPKYLEKLADSPDEQQSFEETVKYLNDFSKSFRAQQNASGREVVSVGWFCDENGNWGGWSVTRPAKTKSQLQEMRENQQKVADKNAKKKEQAEKTREKREKLQIRRNKIEKQTEEKLNADLGGKFLGYHHFEKVDKYI